MKPEILIVDDQPAVCKAVKTLLSPDYNVRCTSDGNKALENIRETGAPDLIFADVDMPECDGHTFLEALKNDPRFSDIPVIMISNLDAGQNRVSFIEAGAEDYLEKPLSKAELKSNINKHLFTTYSHCSNKENKE